MLKVEGILDEETMGECNNNEPQQTTTSIAPDAAACRANVGCIAVHASMHLLKKFWQRMCTCNTPILFWMSAYSLLTVLSLCCALCISSLLMCIQHQSTICLLLGFERPTYSRPPFRKRRRRPPWEDASCLNDYGFGGVTILPNVESRKGLFQCWKE